MSDEVADKTSDAIAAPLSVATDPATAGEAGGASEAPEAESAGRAPGVSQTGDGDGEVGGAETDDAEASDAVDDSAAENGQSPLDLEGEIAADYLEELLDIADFDGDIDTYVEGRRPHVSVLTDGDVLVGTHGEVLEALQELSRLAVMTETGNRSRLMLDVSGYRERRRKVLTDLASDAVEEVRSSGDSVRLEPMNPFERKIIHDVVADAGLISESEGEEPQRRVVIAPSA